MGEEKLAFHSLTSSALEPFFQLILLPLFSEIHQLSLLMYSGLSQGCILWLQRMRVQESGRVCPKQPDTLVYQMWPEFGICRPRSQEIHYWAVIFPLFFGAWWCC